MSDEDVRALFHRVDDGPPLGIDVHDVMAHGHKVRARRTRLAVAGSALAVAAAAAVVGLSLGGEVRPPDLERPAGPSSTPPTSQEEQYAPPGQTAPPGDIPSPPQSASGTEGAEAPPPAVPGAGGPPQQSGK